MLPREIDRRRVEVDAVDARLRIGACDRDARDPATAGEVGDSRRRVGVEPLVEIGDRGKPLAPDEVRVDGAGEGRLPLVEVGSVGREREPGAGAVRLHQLIERAGERHEQPPERRHVVEAVGVEQRLVVAGGQAEASRGGVVRVLVQVQDAARGLLLEPLARIALVDAGGRREPGRGGGTEVGQRPVEPEPVTEVDREHVEGLDRSHEQLADERVATLLAGRGISRHLRHLLRVDEAG